MSQYRLAQVSGVTKQTVSRLELGEAQPSWDTVQALARGLGVAVTAFVVEREAPVVPEPKPRGRPRKEGAPAAKGQAKRRAGRAKGK